MELRKIVFRAKCKDNGEWVYGSYIQSYNKQDWIVQDGDFFAVDSDTVGQFTGFYDRGGKEIYEGDILSYVFTKVKYLVYYSYIKCSLSFNPCCNVDNDSIIHNSWIGVDIYGNVIGNKYDNPELLENY